MQRSQDAKEPSDDSEPTHTGTRSVQGVREKDAERALPRETVRGSTRPSAFGLPPSGVRHKVPPATPSTLEQAFTSAVVEKRPDLVAHGREASRPAAVETHGSTPTRSEATSSSTVKAKVQATRAPPTTAQPSASRPQNAPKGHAASVQSQVTATPSVTLEPIASAQAGSGLRSGSAVMTPRALGAPLPAAPAAPDERHPTPRVKTDIEQLLPISHVAKSLPEPPRIPLIEPVRSSPRRFPWISLATFALMITASALTLTRYSGIRASESEPAMSAHEGSGHSEYELARTQFARGELANAERSILSALRKNSRPREYHALYAEVLERAGRHREAVHERGLAAE